MQTVRFLVLSWAAVLAWSIPAAAAVTVSFIEPENYSDANLDDSYQVGAGDKGLNEIQRHLESLGERYLASGQELKVDILDIDLAGRHEPWRVSAQGVRIMRDITWPRIKLRFVLENEGTAATTAEESVIDMNYLGRHSVYYSSDRLRYEKQMLDDWFRARFVEHRAPR
ncbi:MAG TPA: DUF3016 domain-containing protein [Burkholderiales bacterium]|nr:DUF3016 domain-containing protein [Burkholderiales bacterium]